MKKLILLLVIALMATSSVAQILNNSFENLNSNGSIKNWGNAFITQVSLDSNGVATSDSIVFDNQLYFSTNDAYTGTKALEMRNAFNFTSNLGIAGRAKLTPNDSDYAAFVPMVPVAQKPLFFSFYYKFLPSGIDTAFASMIVSDSNGVEIGSVSAEITTSTSIYQLYNQAVNYSSNDPAAFVSIFFSTAKPGSNPSFGTRFLVDDVNLLATSLVSQRLIIPEIQCFPNPVQNQVFVSWKLFLPGTGRVELCDAAGKLLKTIALSGGQTELAIDTADLPSGSYFLSLIDEHNKISNTFIK